MHETGHLLGLSDRYGSNTAQSQKGYENDLMASGRDPKMMGLSISHYKNILDFANFQDRTATQRQIPVKKFYSICLFDVEYYKNKNNQLLYNLKR